MWNRNHKSSLSRMIQIRGWVGMIGHVSQVCMRMIATGRPHALAWYDRVQHWLCIVSINLILIADPFADNGKWEMVPCIVVDRGSWSASISLLTRTHARRTLESSDGELHRVRTFNLKVLRWNHVFKMKFLKFLFFWREHVDLSNPIIYN